MAVSVSWFSYQTFKLKLRLVPFPAFVFCFYLREGAKREEWWNTRIPTVLVITAVSSVCSLYWFWKEATSQLHLVKVLIMDEGLVTLWGSEGRLLQPSQLSGLGNINGTRVSSHSRRAACTPRWVPGISHAYSTDIYCSGSLYVTCAPQWKMRWLYWKLSNVWSNIKWIKNNSSQS